MLEDRSLYEPYITRCQLADLVIWDGQIAMQSFNPFQSKSMRSLFIPLPRKEPDSRCDAQHKLCKSYVGQSGQYDNRNGNDPEYDSNAAYPLTSQVGIPIAILPLAMQNLRNRIHRIFSVASTNLQVHIDALPWSLPQPRAALSCRGSAGGFPRCSDQGMSRTSQSKSC